jgi:hypothetical protein
MLQDGKRGVVYSYAEVEISITDLKTLADLYHNTK